MQRLLIGVTGVLLAMLALAPGAAGQTELEPVPDAVLTPPQTGLLADLSVVVPPGEFPFSWVELQRLTTTSGGSVVKARAESIERDGRTVAYGVAELRLPPSAFGSVFGEIIGFGTLTDASIEASAGAVAAVTVTLSESSSVPVPAGGLDAEGRLSRAMGTAADVLFTIVGVVIVVAAAVFPLGVIGLAGYAVWRWSRRRFESTVEVTRRLPADADREPEYADS